MNERYSLSLFFFQGPELACMQMSFEVGGSYLFGYFMLFAQCMMNELRFMLVQELRSEFYLFILFLLLLFMCCMLLYITCIHKCSVIFWSQTNP